jgi:rhodanese-related sulfurtransferase/DNA-directed RNA polymerase subunit RPC12/RpoP
MKQFIHLSLFVLVAFIFTQCNSSSAKPAPQKAQEEYVCLPCGQDCDKTIHNKAGTCSACNMQLVKRSSVSFKTISPGEICSYIASHPGVVLLDVRTKEEFEGKADPDFGTLKNAINIPIQQLEKRLPEIDSLKNKEIIVFCSHSHRSPRASHLLTQNGFTNVTNMAVGMSGMKDKACMR